ncbi:MAG: ATP-binding protein [Bacteroidetes bacterium]|nr:ATP-binding protein [Bacteroidota bacterium]
MLDSLLLKSLIVTHKDRFLTDKKLIDREVLQKFDKEIDSREVIFISGIRRSGKSSLMSLIAERLIDKKHIKKENILFINFEDERFINFTVEDFDGLFQTYIELENPKGKKYLFFDEIQNISSWERWVNRLYEFEDVKIFLTGSNASLVSSSISTSLTGRNRQIMNYTFSFREFLVAEGLEISSRDLLLAEKVAGIKRAFGDYMKYGGFPEVVKNKDVMIADQYFKDIIHRDVISYYNIRNVKELRELCLYLITNSGCLVSYESLRKTIDAKNATTIKNYINILNNVYLIYSLPIYDYSVKKQIYNPDKYYVSDLGFYHAIGFKFSENTGKMLENLVFEQLLREDSEIYYWKSSNGREVDFLLRRQAEITKAIQVTYALTPENRDREINGLLSAKKEIGEMSCLILTYDQEEIINLKDGAIEVLPVWKWLL